MLSRRLSSSIVVAGLFAIPALVLGSAKASPARLQFAQDQQKANELVQGLTAQRTDLTYIDVAHGVWDNGKLFGKLLPVFVEDGIHLNDVGRKEWTRVIKPQVDKEAARKDACR